MIREESNSSGPKGSTYNRQGNDVYALAVLFTAHTGVRASELQGLQVQDVTLDIPGTVGGIRIERTAKRKNRVWTYGTPKSDASSDRVVPWHRGWPTSYGNTSQQFTPSEPASTRMLPYSPGGAIAMCSIGLSRYARQACTSTICSPPAEY